ncbi:MAG: hypothetical protein HC837_15065 [Chloroflexaceae bacterium]|nr:hypothetical protein [Chloroflexaceae bacterium]
MNEPATRSSGRVSIDSSVHDLYKQLAEGNDPEHVPFHTMKDMFMLAACLGYRHGQRRPLPRNKRQILHWMQFSDQMDMPILKAMAIATTGDILILGDLEQVFLIAEEYANAGIEELKMHVLNQPGQPLWNLVELLRS